MNSSDTFNRYSFLSVNKFGVVLPRSYATFCPGVRTNELLSLIVFSDGFGVVMYFRWRWDVCLIKMFLWSGR